MYNVIISTDPKVKEWYCNELCPSSFSIISPCPVLFITDITIVSSKSNMFSLWYNCYINHLMLLNNNHSINCTYFFQSDWQDGHVLANLVKSLGETVPPLTGSHHENQQKGNLQNTYIGVMVSMLTSSMVDCGFEPWSSQTTLRRKNRLVGLELG